jgi:mannose-6-phosphate isomerase-like protein (cupin superfamily)
VNESFYIGNYREDALNGPNRGWIVGTFIQDLPRKNDELEIMYWEFKAGEATNHPLKVSSIIECTLILKGRTRCVIDGQEKILKAGDYIVIKPGVPNNNVFEILEDVSGITIKAPSDPTAKKVINTIS